MFHSAFGIFLVEELFGTTLVNSDGDEVFVRDVAEQHVLEDLGRIPSLSDWLNEIDVKPWMAGAATREVTIVDGPLGTSHSDCQSAAQPDRRMAPDERGAQAER